MRFRIKENIYGKDNNNEINKKKYKKSMSPFVSLDAGDVEKTIDIFNQGFGNDCIMCGESTSVGEALHVLNRIELDEQTSNYKFPTYTYFYKGPVYRFEKVYTVLKDPIYTMAQNEKQAATMIKGKLKKMFGFDMNAKLDIDDNNVMKSIQQNNEYQYYQNKKKEQKKDLSGAEFIGSIGDNDIYYLDGYYIANDIAFASYEDARDYLED